MRRLAMLMAILVAACALARADAAPPTGAMGTLAPASPQARPELVDAAPLPTPAQARALQAQAEQALERATDDRARAFARLDLESARELQDALRGIDEATGDLADVLARLDETRRQKEADEDRVRLADHATGPQAAVLLRHRRELPSPRAEQTRLEQIRARATAAELRRLDTADALAALESPTAGVAPGAPAMDAQQRVARRAYLEPLLAATRREATLLNDLEEATARYVTLLEEYRAFLGSHVLWLPNMRPVGQEDFAELGGQLRWYASGEFWSSVLEGLAASIEGSMIRWLGAIAAVLVTVMLRGRMLRLLRTSNARVGAANDRFSATMQALVATAVLAAPMPLAAFLAGTLLRGTLDAGPVGAIGEAMLAVVGLVALLHFLLRLCAAGGVAEVHFRWPPVVRSALARSAWVLLLFAMPPLVICFTAIRTDEKSGGGALARWSMILCLLVMAAVSVRLFSPRRGIFAPLIEARPRGWLSTLRPLWYTLLVAMPVLLACAAAAGYVLTAAAIAWKMSRTYWLILGIAIGLSLIARLGDSAFDRFGLRSDLEEQEEQRTKVQVGRFVRLLTFLVLLAGLVWAWADLLPAAAVLDNYALWRVGGDANTPGTPVTPADLVLAALSVAVTVALVRDLPGFLSVAVLRRFPLDASARYALVAIARYFIVVVGMAATFAFLHIGWANVQWLAAAVTVGLGFGLQEIFANFVSGLIMLAERPVSVGDVVTVDTVTGRVKKIATRATTIVDGDNRDVIIPNKQFITGRIVNWTLGGNAVRFVLPVGVAYGSDLQKAQRILREAVTGVTGVLASPAPEVLLRTLGPSSIDFELWFYCDRPADGTAARHELVQRVVSMLGAEGIAIPFPQMEVRMVPAGAVPAGAAPAESRA